MDDCQVEITEPGRRENSAVQKYLPNEWGKKGYLQNEWGKIEIIKVKSALNKKALNKWIRYSRKGGRFNR